MITDNTFSGASANYPYALISFDGAGGQSWYANPVGGAVITGNTFSSGGDGTKYIRTRGTVSDPSQFDWHSYWTNNTFDSSVIDLSDAGAFTPQAYSYTDGVTFTNVMEIGTSIQNELANAQAGNTILVGAGTYTGDVAPTVDNLTIEGTGAATVLNLGSGYGFNLDNPPAAITGFTLSGFTVNASNTTTYAFKAYKADGLTLTNDTFNGGAGNTGGGVDINTTSNVTFNNVTSSGFHKNGFADTPAYTSADSSAAGDNITLNSITASNDGWAGVAFYSIGGAGGAANMSHVSFTGTDIVSGNGTEGVFIEGDTDANFGAHTTPAYKVTSDGTTLDLTHVAFTGNTLYDVVNYQTAPVNAIGATFGGLTGDAMDSAGRTAEDAKIEDHLDLPALGLVSYYTPVVLTAPIVTVTPAAGSLISSTTTFTITVTGTNVDPAKNNNIWVYLYNADGSKSKGANVDLSSGTGTFTVDTTKLNDGKAWLDVGDLYGADGNHIPGGDTYFKDYIIDNTAPTVSVTPVAGSTLSGTVTFNITINDANPATTTNNKIWVYLYNNAGTQKSKGAKVDLSSGTGTFTVDTTLLDNGSSTLDVGRLEDAAGNFSGASDNYFKDYTIDNVVAPSGPNAPEVITDAATDVTVADATLNGTNGNNDATGHSFWVSLAPFDTTTPNIPSAVYSTPDMGAIAANGTFTATLSSLTTDAVTTGGATGTNLPAITPNTTYYYVAWSNVDGTWYPGATQTFTTASSTEREGTTTTLTVPVLETPTNGTMLNTNNFTFTWDASTGGTSGPITYQFQSSLNPAETDGVLTTGIWSSGTLTTPSILSTGAPDGTWYWQVRAEDGGGNFSDWSPIWSVILDTAATSTATTPPAPTPTFPADNATLTSAALTQVTWTSVTDANMPITYTYEVSNSSTTAADGSFTDPINIGTAGTGLTNPQVSTGGTPEATYYWHVEAVDSIGNKSPWSTTQTFTIDNTSGGGGTPESPAPNAATITVPVLENSTSTPITLSATNVGADVTYAIASGPAHGTLSAVNGAEVDYTPAANSTADDTFTYTASSGGQTSSPATVTITITPVNIAPVSTNVTATSTADAAITITLAATDQDEGDTLTFATTSSPTHGTLGTISGNTVTYTPTSGYSGTDSFTVKANDGHTDSNESTVTINVTAPVVTPQVTTNTNTGGSHSGISGGIIRSSGGTTGGSSGSSGQVLGASTYNFTKNFGIGSRGTDVTQLQLILIADGYLKITTPTGYFGALTKAAVMKYQAANGISATGFVGPLTRAALNKGTLPTTPES
ncbi:MAG: Ig-like domain-containing protein [Candidatus Pacebacteria bacterium]|nr:Ig-like domain-containing protein [Candidatus Paceibacterota bacterium]